MQNPILVKYFTKSALIEANNNSKLNRNNFISDEDMDELTDDKVYPISEHHADGTNVCATVVLNEYGIEADIDISFSEWESLPTKTICAV